MNEILTSATVDELVALQRQQEKIKARIDELKAILEQKATEILKDTKNKTVNFWGKNAIASATITDTIKPVSTLMLQKMLGPVADEWIREKKTAELSDPCKRLLGAIASGNYTVGTLDEAIARISDNLEERRLLVKKLKGKYEKDLQTLRNDVGMETDEASDWAYLITEIVNYQRFLQVLEAAGWKDSVENAIGLVKSAIIVDETIKVTVVGNDLV